MIIDEVESKLVSDLIRAQNKQCYRNSMLGAIAIDGEYVEGVVMLEVGIVIEHAWIVKGQTIIEPTPAMQVGKKNVYFPGPRLSSSEVLAKHTETPSFFNYRNSPEYRKAYVAAYRHTYGDDVADKIQDSMQGLEQDRATKGQQ